MYAGYLGAYKTAVAAVAVVVIAALLSLFLGRFVFAAVSTKFLVFAAFVGIPVEFVHFVRFLFVILAEKAYGFRNWTSERSVDI